MCLRKNMKGMASNCLLRKLTQFRHFNRGGDLLFKENDSGGNLDILRVATPITGPACKGKGKAECFFLKGASDACGTLACPAQHCLTSQAHSAGQCLAPLLPAV